MMTIVVVDLEATCWDRAVDPEMSAKQAEVSEIIEIGAVRLAPDLSLEAEFQSFVRPVAHPALSAFCTQLTTIEQPDVDGAEPFAATFARFVDFLGGQTEGVTFVSWGGYDHNQIKRECLRNGVPAPAWTAVNAKVDFSSWYKAHKNRKKRFGLGGAIRHLGWTFEGTAHRGIDDARNVARVLRHIRDPANMSPQAHTALTFLAERHPEPTHLGHFKARWPDAKGWHPVALKELQRLGLVSDLGKGRGAQLSESGRVLSSSK